LQIAKWKLQNKNIRRAVRVMAALTHAPAALAHAPAALKEPLIDVF
jgi:hypothetical protein